MKYLSSLAGEISILMAHQAQLSQIMKIHLHCQSTAVQQGKAGLAPSRLAWTKTFYCSGFLIVSECTFTMSAITLKCRPSASKDSEVEQIF